MPSRTPKPPSLENLENANADQSPVGIPPNADVTVKFRHQVDASNLGGATRYNNNELDELAAEDFPDEPSDPLTEFLTEWGRYTGYPLKIVRLPDPADRRMPGQTYNRTRFGEIEQLGDTTFDPVNFVNTLQIINGNSGGIFRVWLTDQSGAPIPGARLDRLAISDPPKAYGRDQDRERDSVRYITNAPPPPKPEPSALEVRMQSLQEKLLENALARLIEPPRTETPPAAPVISDEDKLTLLLVKEGGLLPGVVSRIAAIAGSPDAATAKQTWGDWLKDTGGELLRTNPEIADRITNTVGNIVTLVLDRFPGKPSQPQPQPQPVRQLQPGAAPYQDGRIEPLRQTPQVNDTGSIETLDPTVPEDEDEDIMDILEDLFTLLTSGDPLVVNHPTFQQLRKDYPIKFNMALKVIATQPLNDIVEWIKDKSPLYASMLDNPAMGPYYRQRLSELQILCQTPQTSQPAPAPQVDPNDNAQDNEPPQAS